MKLLPLFALFMFSFALYDDRDLVESLTWEKINQEVVDPDYLTVVIVYDRRGDNSIGFEPIYLDFLREHRGLFRTLVYDCADDAELCSEDMKKSLPAITAYKPVGTNPYTGRPQVDKANFTGNSKHDILSKFMGKQMPYFGQTVNGGNMETFLSNKGNKVLLITPKKKPSTLVKAITSKYRERLWIGMAHKDDEDIINAFEPPRMPSLCVVTENGKVWYEGDFNLIDLSAFLDEYAAEERWPREFVEGVIGGNQKDLMVQQHDMELQIENFDRDIRALNKVALVHFYNEKKSENSWEEISTKYRDIALMGKFDCSDEESWEFAQSLGVTSLPQVRLFPENREKKSQLLKFKSHRDIEKALIKDMKYNLLELEPEQVSDFIQATKDHNKLAVLLFSDQPIPIQFLALASNPSVNKKTFFGICRHQVEEEDQRFQIDRFPAIVGFMITNSENNLSFAEYENDMDNYAQLLDYTTQLLSKVYKPSIKITQDDIDDEELEQFTAKEFDTGCVNKDSICAVFLLDGQVESKKNQKYVKDMKIAQIEARKRDIPMTFGWVDGVCQSEFRQAYGINEKSLPNMVIYLGQKGKGSVLEGDFNEADIRTLVDTISDGKAASFDIKDVQIVNRNCGSKKSKKKKGKKGAAEGTQIPDPEDL